MDSTYTVLDFDAAALDFWPHIWASTLAKLNLKVRNSLSIVEVSLQLLIDNLSMFRSSDPVLIVYLDKILCIVYIFISFTLHFMTFCGNF